MTSHEAGHIFWAKLGKKRLRPGGIKATDWLLKKGKFSKQTKVLEVACNMGTTTIEIAKKYGCHITGVDLDKRALEKAKQAVEKENLSECVTLQQANALKLPFDDNTFDIVINEAMLTMLSNVAKEKALKEYYRVLKPGGCLLTHDITFTDEVTEGSFQTLRDVIHVNVHPLLLQDWIALGKRNQFSVQYDYGKMSLMSPSGMIKDEGIVNTLKIIKKGLFNRNNRSMFLNMFHYFRKHKESIYYIAMCLKKEEKK